MVPQQKILRIVKLISLLKSNHRKTVQELAYLLDTGWRTIYRYVELLQEAGFVIDKDFEGRYFIPVWEEKEYSFTGEEASVLQGMIQDLKNHPLKNALLSKIYVQSDLHTAANVMYKAGISKSVSLLNTAIQDQKQVILKKYQSAHSGNITDRLVEPIAFTDHMQSILAFEVSSKSTKFFKLERIGQVEVTSKKVKHALLHEKPETDVFGMSEKPAMNVKIRLGLRAGLLLKEEYPPAAPFLFPDADGFILQCEVKGFKGIGRFLAGILDDIYIESPIELHEWLIQYWNTYLSKQNKH